jgi:hypothetical protein
MNRFIRIVFILSLVFGSNLVVGSSNLQLEEAIEFRLEKRLAKVTGGVKVIVSSKFKVNENNIHSPFLRTNSRSEVIVSKVNIRILMPDISSENREIVNQTIVELMKAYSVPYDIEYKFINRPSLTPKAQVDKSKFIIVENGSKAFFAFIKEEVFSFFKFMSYFLMLIGFCKLVLAIYFRYPHQKESKEGLGSLTDEKSVIGNKVKVVDLQSKRKVVNSKIEKMSYNVYSDESLVSFFTDCYWCREDSYALFVWNRIDEGRKKKIILKMPIFPEYFGHIQSCGERDMIFIKDSYYMRPLPIGHISNQKLLEFIKKDKGILNKISLIRRKIFLNYYRAIISSIKIDMTGDTLSMQELAKTAASAKRSFVFESLNFFTDPEKEDQFVTGNSDYGLAFTFPTLAWTRMLSNKKLLDVMSNYDIFDLANIWLGPKKDLQRMFDLLEKNDQVKLIGLIEINKPTSFVSTYRNFCNDVAIALNEAETLELYAS